MKAGKNISMAEKERLYFVLLEFADVFSLQPEEHAWAHYCTSAPHRHWKFTPDPSASTADSMHSTQRRGETTPRRDVKEGRNTAV